MKCLHSLVLISLIKKAGGNDALFGAGKWSAVKLQSLQQLSTTLLQSLSTYSCSTKPFNWRKDFSRVICKASQFLDNLSLRIWYAVDTSSSPDSSLCPQRYSPSSSFLISSCMGCSLGCMCSGGRADGRRLTVDL